MLFAACFLFFSVTAQSKPAYRLYKANGKKASYKKMIRFLSAQDIVLIGELHNNAISHWMELEITKDCKKNRNLVLGAEMFEHDNQEALDLYLKEKISAKGLDSMARLWKNYATDYAPLVNFAKENQLVFAATNIPRRYASMVSKKGFDVLDTIPVTAKSWMAPLPIPYDSALPGYRKMMQMMEGHGTVNMPKAQAIKDATMAHFI
jgi:uncharacterized iron-regulated protein